ncbi:uncharacterized protein [Nicotiana sylvestris]|uniref:uncharacterized protein n=1 Tax=Nicotiana sylvestris TaxID=4096 RepID=UPI00388C3987
MSLLCLKSVPGVFIDYVSTQKGYIIYDIEAGKFIVSIDVIFKESVYPLKHPRSKFFVAHDCSSILSPLFPISDPPPSTTTDLNLILDDNLSPPVDPIAQSLSLSSPSPPPNPVSSPSFAVTHDPSALPTDSLLPRKYGRTLKPSISLIDYSHPYLPLASTSCLYPIHHFASYTHLPAHFKSFCTSFSVDTKSTSYSQTIKDDWWIKAMNLEIEALEQNHT